MTDAFQLQALVEHRQHTEAFATELIELFDRLDAIEAEASDLQSVRSAFISSAGRLLV